jgi:hypothetical protein
MPHIIRNAEHADMLYIHGSCDVSATATVEECCRWFPMRRITYRRVLPNVFNTLREHGTISSAHVSSERPR